MKYLTLLLFLLSSLLIQAQYIVSFKDTTLIDASRSSRNIPVHICYPANVSGTDVPLAVPPPGGFPVVVVGHGFSMDYTAFTNFRDSLVPKGYIVLIPNTETGIIGVSHGNFGADMSFLINYMQAQNTNSSSRFYGKIRNKSAIIGHSMGGGATYLGANGNSNVTTTVTFSAAETSPSAIAACSSIHVPSLVFVGENDCVAPASSNQTPMYNALASSCKTKITIKNGGHCQYSNSSFTCDFGEGTCRGLMTILTRAQQQPIVFSFLYKWFDFYLRGNCNAFTTFQNQLTSDSRITYVQSCSYNLPIAIATASAVTKCPENTVNISVPNRFASYNWNTGSLDTQINPIAASTYFVVVTDSIGCKDTSNLITINNFNPLRSSISPSGILRFCDTLPHEMLHVDSGHFVSYIWNTGDSGRFLLADSLGMYYCITRDTQGCIATTDTLLLTNVSTNTPNIIPRSIVYFCINDTITYSTSTPFVSYNWSTGDTSATTNSPDTGSIFVSTIDSNGCIAHSDTVTAMYYAPIPLLVINSFDSLVASEGFTSYSWYDMSGTILSTNRIFIPSDTTNYFYVTAYDSNSCLRKSELVRLQFSTGIEHANNVTLNIQVYPNPFTEQLTIQLPYNINSYFLQIIDMKGAVLFCNVYKEPTQTLSFKGFSDGIYLLKICTEQQTYITRISKD